MTYVTENPITLMNLKKISRKLFLLSALMWAGTGPAFSTERLLGDVNGDGEVNIGDVTAVVNHIGGNTLDGFNFMAANVNGDGEINIGDVTGIVNIIGTKTIGRNGTSSLKFASASIDKTQGAAAFSVDVYRAGSTGAITYSSNAPAVATVDSSTGVITIVGAGTATITATLSANAGLSAATATLLVNISSSGGSGDGTSTNNGYGQPIPEGENGWH